MSRQNRRSPALPDRLVAVWVGRRESAEEIAQRTRLFFHEIQSLDPALAMWYDKKGSLKRSLAAPLNLSNFDDALKFVEKGEETSEGPPYEPLPTGGFSYSGWNCREDHTTMSFHALVGGETLVVPNTFELNWHANSHTPVMGVEVLASVIGFLSTAWDADFCKVIGRYDPPGVQQKHVEWKIVPPDVGWMIQLANRTLSPADVPSAWRVEPCGNGTLVIVREKPIDMHNPEDFALADRVRVELGLPMAWSRRKPEPRLPQ